MKYLLAIIITIIVLTTMFSGCKDTHENIADIVTNEKIIQTKGFNISSESTELETFARGAIFLSGREGVPEHAQVVALIEIDQKDWGGVSFCISDNWHISSITSSYPEDATEKIPEHFVNMLRTASTAVEWNKEIRIGADSISTGGGKGTIIIELDANKEAINTYDTFSMLIGVGSEERDGIKIRNPDSKRIEIPIQ